MQFFGMARGISRKLYICGRKKYQGCWVQLDIGLPFIGILLGLSTLPDSA